MLTCVQSCVLLCVDTMTCMVCSVLCRIKMLPVVGHVQYGLRETLRVSAATANVALALMKYTHA